MNFWKRFYLRYFKYFFSTSYADRKELMLHARYSIDDALMCLYSGGVYDPQDRYLALFGDKIGVIQDWSCWSKGRHIANVIESFLRMVDNTITILTFASLNPDFSISFIVSDWYDQLREYR